MNILLSVMNDKFIGESFFQRFYTIPGVAKIKERTDNNLMNDCFIRWMEQSGDAMYERGFREASLQAEYNILHIPYEGLCYLVARDRALKDESHRYCVVTMKENFQTRVIAHDCYNLFINSRFRPTFDLFKEFFATEDHNILMDEYFDPVLKDAQEKVSPLISDAIDTYLPIQTKVVD